MGADKLSLRLGKRTVFERSLDALIRARVDEIIAVVRKKTRKGTGCYGKKVKFVLNPHSRRGMSTSVRKGIQAIDPKADGFLIALGDQPFLKSRTVNALIRAFSKTKAGIVLPCYQGKEGHPVLFDRCYRQALFRLKGDVGGRSVIERNPQHVVIVPTRSKAVLQDIDTRKDYEEARRPRSTALRRKKPE
jgi:molybdenum cofactor cytidylyltransferase